VIVNTPEVEIVAGLLKLDVKSVADTLTQKILVSLNFSLYYTF